MITAAVSYTHLYETGEVLYGPVERDFVTYFSEWYLDMKKQCRAVLSEKGTLSIAAGEKMCIRDRD